MIGRIQSRSVFLRVRSEGIHRRCGVLSCTMLSDSRLSRAHVGYALGRHVGSAVRRNRLRRQLRELVRSRADRLAPGWYVMGASPRAAGATYDRLGHDLDRLIAAFGPRESAVR